MVVPAPCSSPWSIASASRSAETGDFRFVFEAEDRLVSADLSVCWYETQNLAYLRFIEVDRVLRADRATSDAIEAWVKANEQLVFTAAMESL